MAKAYLPGRLSLTPVELAQGAGSTDGKQGERFDGHVVGGSGAVTPLLRDVEAPASERASRRRRPTTRPSVAAVAAPLLVVAVWAAVRWSGTAPFGSDNDEYRLVAEALLAGDGPVVAGVEATKYPLGYPLLLALVDLASLPVTTVALVANVVLVAVLGLVVARVCRSVGRRGGAVPAAVYAVGGAGLWGSVFVTMPDLAFVVAAAVVLWWVGRVRSTRDVWLLVALVALATSLKSVGLLVALAASLALLAAPAAARRLAWAPATASLALTAAMAALGAGHPEHTTGYARTFLLVDPTDAAAGRSSLLGLLERIPDRAHLVLRDVEMAVVGQQVPRPWSWLLVTVLLVAGTWALRSVATRRAYVVAFIALWLPAMAVWPYSSVRFQLPLVPIAAVGVAWLSAAMARRVPLVGTVLVWVAVAGFLVSHGRQIERDAATEEAWLGAVAADTDAMARWGTGAIPEDDVIAAFAYREVAHRLDRPVVPLGYTSDLAQLLAEADAAGARWLVVMPSLYRARGELEVGLVAAFPERLRLAHDTATVDTYALLPPPG
jgi:hypothetical protein